MAAVRKDVGNMLSPEWGEQTVSLFSIRGRGLSIANSPRVIVPVDGFGAGIWLRRLKKRPLRCESRIPGLKQLPVADFFLLSDIRRMDMSGDKRAIGCVDGFEPCRLSNSLTHVVHRQIDQCSIDRRAVT